jgi:hypothetical protein
MREEGTWAWRVGLAKNFGNIIRGCYVGVTCVYEVLRMLLKS